MKNKITFAIINVSIYFFIYSLTSFYYLSYDIEKWGLSGRGCFVFCYVTSTLLQLFLSLITNDLKKDTND